MLVIYLLSKIRACGRYRATAHELSGLLERELADLRFSRYEIYGIARKHAAA